MRMRKKKWAEPFIEEHRDFIIANPNEYKGKWKEVLNRESLHVEVGAGKGDYFINMSKMYPQEGWVAIEKDYSCGALAAKKALEDRKDNQLMIISDATDIGEWFACKEVDVIHLNFSDPWPKSKTKKRRLSHASFINKYLNILSDSGQLILKTDNEQFFEFSLVELTNNGFKLDQVWVNFRRDEHEEDAITEYESKFMALGQPIFRAIFTKRDIVL